MRVSWRGISAQDAGWGVEASRHAETLFTGFARSRGGVGSGRSLVPRQREDIQRERRYGSEMVTALPDNGQRGGLDDGRSPAAASGWQARLAADADCGKAGPDIAGDQGRVGRRWG